MTTDPLLALFRGIQPATISDAMFGLGLPDSAMGPEVRLMVGQTLVARARTVGRTPLTGNAGQAELAADYGFAIQEVIDGSGPGTVIVIATGGIDSHANWGGNMGIRARATGALGLVTDGAFRDRAEMEALGLTIFAQSAAVRAGQHRFATTTRNGPVICGGVLVRPDDILVGDADGVIVVPPAHAEDIARKSRELMGIEHQMHDFMGAGATLKEAVMKYKVR